MESGPIDYITNDAKYTLSEEKLLRRYQDAKDDKTKDDVKFEAKTLVSAERFGTLLLYGRHCLLL